MIPFNFLFDALVDGVCFLETEVKMLTSDSKLICFLIQVLFLLQGLFGLILDVCDELSRILDLIVNVHNVFNDFKIFNKVSFELVVIWQ